MNSYKTKYGYLKSTFVISRYIDNPLLIYGKKFDLRLYILVTSYKPLKVWRYNEGFCRLCCSDYTPISQTKDSDDPNKALFSHLTNVSY